SRRGGACTPTSGPGRGSGSPPWPAPSSVSPPAVPTPPTKARSAGPRGPYPYSKRPSGAPIAPPRAEHGGAMRRGDLATHVGEWTTPLRAAYRDVEVAELPPPTQGVTALEALRILDGLPERHDPVDREHLRIEALKQALADRDQHVTDPDHMAGAATDLLAASWIEARRRVVRLDRATDPTPGVTQPGG